MHPPRSRPALANLDQQRKTRAPPTTTSTAEQKQQQLPARSAIERQRWCFPPPPALNSHAKRPATLFRWRRSAFGRAQEGKPATTNNRARQQQGSLASLGQANALPSIVHITANNRKEQPTHTAPNSKSRTRPTSLAGGRAIACSKTRQQVQTTTSPGPPPPGPLSQMALDSSPSGEPPADGILYLGAQRRCSVTNETKTSREGKAGFPLRAPRPSPPPQSPRTQTAAEVEQQRKGSPRTAAQRCCLPRRTFGFLPSPFRSGKAMARGQRHGDRSGRSAHHTTPTTTSTTGTGAATPGRGSNTVGAKADSSSGRVDTKERAAATESPGRENAFLRPADLSPVVVTRHEATGLGAGPPQTGTLQGGS